MPGPYNDEEMPGAKEIGGGSARRQGQATG
jgi:hypothetical protein